MPLFQSNWANDYGIFNIYSVSSKKTGSKFFSLFSIWAKSASHDQFYRFYEELIWALWKAAQNEKRYFKFICSILEDLINISLLWQLNEYRKSMTDGILPLWSWLSIPQSLSRSKHNEKKAINKCNDQHHHHGRR